MSATLKREIYFSTFMFTTDLRPDDTGYARILIDQLKAIREMGYDGFDVHIASPPAPVDHQLEVDSYMRLKNAFDEAGLQDAKFATNVLATRICDPTSPYKEQRQEALSYLKSRVDITSVLGGADSVMSGPFLYPYGAYPITDNGDPIWSDALQDWMKQRYLSARSTFEDFAEYAAAKRVTLALEPVKNWETPGPTMVSECLDFLDGISSPCGVTLDTAQILFESQGPTVFKENVARAARENRLSYVHISAPDRGALRDCWIPWDFMLGEIDPVYSGPYMIEVFNAIPPFESSMRMVRRRFWRPGEDNPEPHRDSAYQVASAALETMREKLAALPSGRSDSSRMPATPVGDA
jgi:sugar phosphate isomerase/epimerase